MSRYPKIILLKLLVHNAMDKVHPLFLFVGGGSVLSDDLGNPTRAQLVHTCRDGGLGQHDRHSRMMLAMEHVNQEGGPAVKKLINCHIQFCQESNSTSKN